MKKIEKLRNKNGYINLNNLEKYREKGEIVTGSNAKTWFNVNGVRILFKEYNSELPAFGEVLYSKVANSCGVNCAKYDFAMYDGKTGTISYDFLKEDEVYYDFLELTLQFSDTKFTYEEAIKDRKLLSLYNNKYNDLSSIKSFISKLFNMDKGEKKIIEIELIKMFILDTIFWHRDRTLWNYGVLINEVNDKVSLAPCHDNSCILYLEKGEKYIEEMIVSLINGGKLGEMYSKNNVFNISLDEDDSIGQLIKFYSKSSLEIRKVIENVVEGIDIEKEVEQLCKIFKIGDISSLWIKAVIDYRKITVLKGIENVNIKDEVAHKPNNITFSKRK